MRMDFSRDAFWLADAVDVVTSEVDEHFVLGWSLFVIEQLALERGVFIASLPCSRVPAMGAT